MERQIILRQILILAFFIFLTAQIFSQEAVREEKKAIPPAEQIEDAVKDTSSTDYNAEQIIEMNKPALISIWYHTDNYYSYFSYTYKDTTLLNGSGFIIHEDGFIGTNYHVVDGIDSLLVKTSDGTFYDAQLLIIDEKNDMAILKIKNSNGTKFPTIKFANSDIVKVGQEVFAIGSPLGYEYTISQGIVAGIRENEKVSFTDPVTYLNIEKSFEKVIQITAAISPGNSGGALFNKKGEVIGITTYTYTGYGNLNFAIAINSFVKLRNSVNITDYEHSEEAKKKIAESLFFSNLRLADNFKNEALNNWYYVKQKDTMKTIDTFVVKQDSIARMNFSKAESFYQKCLNMQPDSFGVYQNLMDLYVYCESFTKAENLYTSIKEKFQSDSLLGLLSSTLANAYSTSKEYKKALQFYQKILAKDTNDTYSYYQMCDIYEKMGDYDNAVKGYNRLLKKDPGYTQAYVQLGRIYYDKLHEEGKAKKYFNTAYEKEMLVNGSTYIIDLPYYLGMIAAKEGKSFEALLYYMELKAIYTYSPEDNAKKVKLFKIIKKYL